MGVSFVEAMAARLPVIATPVGGIIDFLFDPDHNKGIKSTGLFCAVNDPKSIARQVRRYLDDPALREAIRQNAFNLVSQQYDWDLIAARMRNEVFKPLV